MGTIENIRNLFAKNNWRYSVLVVWLIGGIGFMRFFPVVGVFIFLPMLAFLVFLLFLSLISKKNVEEYPTYQIIIFFFISLPFLILIFAFLVILALVAVLVYVFLQSWFTLYWCYLTANRVDKTLKNRKYNKFTRGLELFGGFILSILLLGIFTTGSIIYVIFLSPSIPIFINLVYLVVGIILISYFVYNLYVLAKKKILVGWSGLFLVLISIYTFYLVIQVFLSLSSSGTTTLTAQIGLYILDIGLLIYNVSAILSDKAELLVKKLNSRFFGIDTAMITLIASKACYEFYNNFNYDLLNSVPALQNILQLDTIILIGSDLSLYKNVGILIFFILLIVIVGSYELRKFIVQEQGPGLKQLEEVLKSEELEEFDELGGLGGSEEETSEYDTLEGLIQDAEMEDDNVPFELKDEELEAEMAKLRDELKSDSSRDNASVEPTEEGKQDDVSKKMDSNNKFDDSNEENNNNEI